MDHQGVSNLLNQAMGLDLDRQHDKGWLLDGYFVLVEDCVETSGSFVLLHLLKHALSPNASSVAIFIAFSQSFSHYDRVLRKLGCNLSAHRDSKRFLFIDMLMLQCPVRSSASDKEDRYGGDGLMALYGNIEKAVNTFAQDNKSVTVMIDDVSLLEVAANGDVDNVINFLHYCQTLSSEYGSSLVVLNHGDIYSCKERPSVILQMEYLADIVVKAEPLSTGLAADVHGQLTVLKKVTGPGHEGSKDGTRNFHFKIKENSVEYFYPGSSTR